MTAIRTGSRLAHNGVRYQLENEPGSVTYRDATAASTDLVMKVWTARGTTSTSGQITFTLPAGYFSAVYNVGAQVVYPTGSNYAAFCQVTSVSTTSVTVQTLENNISGVLLGGVISGLKMGTTAVPIHLMVTGV